jgi:hypothetical protein
MVLARAGLRARLLHKGCTAEDTEITEVFLFSVASVSSEVGPN